MVDDRFTKDTREMKSGDFNLPESASASTPDETPWTDTLGYFSITGKELGKGGMGIVMPAVFDLGVARRVVEEPLNELERLVDESVPDLDKRQRDKLKIQMLENNFKETPAVFDRDIQQDMIFPTEYEKSQDWWGFYKGIYIDRALANIFKEIKENVVQKSVYFTTMHLAQPDFYEANPGDQKVTALPVSIRMLDKEGRRINEENIGGVKLTWQYHEDREPTIERAVYSYTVGENERSVQFFQINEAIARAVGGRDILEKTLEEVLGAARECIAHEMDAYQISRIPLAIKTLIPGEEIQSSDAPERLIAEAKSQIKASDMSDHVVPAFGYKAKGQKVPFFVMTRCDGAFENAQKVGREFALEAILQATMGLRELHNHSIFHRDMKPSNIFWVKKDGEDFYMVADFGIAKEKTQATVSMGTIKGTVAYMAPEQAAGDNHIIDQRTDTYSLCASLYSMLLGEYPFFKTFDEQQSLFSKAYHGLLSLIGKERKKIEMTGDVKTMSKVREGDTQDTKESKMTLADASRIDNFLELLLREGDPNASVDDENVILRGIQKYKEDRYTDDQLIEDIERLKDGKKSKHAGKNRGYRFERWRAQNSGLWKRIKEVGLIAGVSALAFGLSWLYYLNTKTIGYFVENNPVSVSQSGEMQSQFYGGLAQKLVDRKVGPHIDEVVRRIDENAKGSETLEEKFREAIPYLIKEGQEEWTYHSPYNVMPGVPVRKAIVAYRLSGDADYLVKAKKIAESLELILEIPSSRAYGMSFLAAAELGEITRDSKFTKMALIAAENLKARFNPKRGIIIPCRAADVGKDKKEDVLDLVEVANELPLFMWAYQHTEGEKKTAYETMVRNNLSQIEKLMIRTSPWWKQEGLENSVHSRFIWGFDSKTQKEDLQVAPPGYEAAGFKDADLRIKADIARYHASAMHLFTLAGETFEDEHYFEVAKNLSGFFVKKLPTSSNVSRKRGDTEVNAVPYVSFFDLVTEEVVHIDTGSTNTAALTMYGLASHFPDDGLEEISKRMFNAVTKNYLVRNEANRGVIAGFVPDILGVGYQSSVNNDLAYLQLLHLLRKEK